MRIVQLVMAPQHRGAELFALQLSRELMKKGEMVKCVALYKSDASQVNTTGVDWVNLNAKRTGLVSFELLKSLRDQLKSFSPDVVQANAGDTLKYAVLVKMSFGFRFKIIFRNASTVSSYLKTRTQRWLYSWLYKRVDYVISVSDYSREDFKHVFPFMSEKITTIPNGLDLIQPFKPLAVFNPDEFNIVHVGGYTFEKNHIGLFRIFEQVLKSIPHARLWLVGDGLLRVSVEKYIREQKLDRVEIVGIVNNPLDYMAAASVVVLPSIIEGMPGVLLEAMLCSAPVVAYKVGGIGEVVIPGKTGFLIAPNNEAAFVQAVKSIMNNKPTEMIEAAQQFVCSTFASDIIANRFTAIYHKLATQ